jgi:hypothetical protein
METPMIRALLIRALSAPCFFSRACQCMASLSTCHEVGASDLVLIGAVESIEPMFLNRWNTASPASMSAFARGYPVETQLLAGPQPFHIDQKSCARQVLLLPKKEGN